MSPSLYHSTQNLYPYMLHGLVQSTNTVRFGTITINARVSFNCMYECAYAHNVLSTNGLCHFSVFISILFIVFLGFALGKAHCHHSVDKCARSNVKVQSTTRQAPKSSNQFQMSLNHRTLLGMRLKSAYYSSLCQING